ncbi:ribose ABC transporter permease [Clostridium bovifaecis]|uniref:Ribose ABC transporter permease n=1 Tax=Clostridium bovifaecis TaxID=2184719 RepID=A0A6I6ER73_9CLOT|nr:ribose ABC transporter permease [Clostridium bovifaecis]
MNKLKLNRIWSKYSFLFSFVVLFMVASIANSQFLSYGNLLNIIRQVSIIGIISLGMSLVILTGGIDLSVGSSLAFIGGVTIITLNRTGSVFLAVIAGFIAGAAIGLINGLLITKGRIAPFIVTLGVMASMRSLILYIAKGGSIAGKVESYTRIANGEILGIAYPVFVFLICIIAVYIITTKLRVGRYVYAVGSNEKATLLSAISVDKVKIYVYVLCGLFTALAAIIESSRLNSISSASSGVSYELDAIAGVIIGGTRMSGGKGTVLGTFFGILILGVLNNMMNLMNISPYLQGLAKGIIIILAVLLQKKE